MSTIFVCYSGEIEDHVGGSVYCMQKLTDATVYFHPEHRAYGSFPEQLREVINGAEYFVLFISTATANSDWQRQEVERFLLMHGCNNLIMVLTENCSIPEHLPPGLSRQNIRTLSEIEHVFSEKPTSDEFWSEDIARIILKRFEPEASGDKIDRLPTILDARYEKEIIREYLDNGGCAPASKVAIGYPPSWPTVVKETPSTNSCHMITNPLPERQFGRRDADAFVRVDARIDLDPEKAALREKLSFPEAGPRQEIIFQNKLKVGILVSGGIAPGINAVISALVTHHEEYGKATRKSKVGNPHAVEILGIKGGFKALISDAWDDDDMVRLRSDTVSTWATMGGTKLSTSRADSLIESNEMERGQLMETMAHRLQMKRFDILYVIGGEGSMRAAHSLWNETKRNDSRRPLSVIGIPKTMDNDILWVWQSFGFLSAVEHARENLLQLHTEITSNPRVGVVQLFGSSSGFVVSHAAFGSNVCDLALVPELQHFKMLDVCRRVMDVLNNKMYAKQAPCALVVMAEAAIPVDWKKYSEQKYVGLSDDEKKALQTFEDSNRRIIGQTPDNLRSAGLKIVSRVLQEYIRSVIGDGNKNALGFPVKIKKKSIVNAEYYRDYRVFTNEPRHLIRSMAPSVTDTLFGVRLGSMAVDMAMAGYTDCMVSQWLTEYVMVPLKLVVLGRKQLPLEGIFWRTVVSKTGQGDYASLVDIVDDEPSS